MLNRTIGALVLAASLISLTGCAEKASVTTETKAVGPGGTTTTTETKEIKTTGENTSASRPVDLCITAHSQGGA